MDNTEILHIRIPAELQAKLKVLADRKRTTISAHVRQTLWRQVERIDLPIVSDDDAAAPV